MTGVPNALSEHHTQQLFIPTSYNVADTMRSEFTLESLISVLYRFRYLILITTIFSIALSALFTEKIDPVYEARAMVSVGRYIPPIKGETGRLLSNESSKTSYVKAQLPLLRSFTIADLVLSQDKEIAEYLARGVVPKDIAEGVVTSIRAPEINLTTLIEDGTVESSATVITKKDLHRDGMKNQFSLMTAYLELVSYDLIKNSTMVQITAEAKHPGMAARIANAHSQAFIALVRARLLDNARVNLSFLKERKAKSEKQATDARKELVSYAEDNAIFLSIGSKSNSVNKQAGDKMWWLTNNLTQVTRNRAEAEAEYRLVRDNVKGTAAIDESSRDIALNLANKKGDYKALRKEGISSSNPYMRRLSFEIKNLHESLKAGRTAAIKRKEIQYKAIKAQEDLLKREVTELKKESVRESRALVQYALLEQEDESAQALHRQLTQRLEEVYVHLNSNQKHVRMIDEARMPSLSQSRRNYINLIIGTMVGPILGIALAFALDLLDNTIRTANDIQKTVFVPLLGIIPRFSVELEQMIASNYQLNEGSGETAEGLIPETPNETPLSGLSEFETDLTPSAGMVTPEGPSIIGDPSVIGHWSTDIRKKIDPNSKTPTPSAAPETMTPEAPTPDGTLNGGADALLPQTTEEEPGHFAPNNGVGEPLMEGTGTEIGVDTGTTAGSTTLLTSSSLVLVSAPHSIESEAFRNVRTCVTYGSAGDPPKLILVTSGQKHDGKTTVSSNLAISLAQISERTLLIDADLRLPSIHRNFSLSRLTPGLSDYLQGYRDYSEVIFETPIPNLCLMLSGEPVNNPTELIGSKKMTELLELLGDEFDRIIIDSPPITRVADSMLLSRSVDGVVLVVRSGKTPQSVAEAAYGRLKQMDANVLGTVLNDMQSIPGYREMDYYYVTEVYGEEDEEFYDVGGEEARV